MSLLPASIPRATDARRLNEDPLGFLAQARSTLGDIFVIREAGPIFSRAPDSAGALAVFGATYHRLVLSDIDTFGLPVSAAERLSLPPKLVNLNRGLHSMLGEQHTQHQRLLMRALSEQSLMDHREELQAGLQTFAQEWQSGCRINLLEEMRRLTLEVSSRLLFGRGYEDRLLLGSLLQDYFQFRREATSPLMSPSRTVRPELIARGNRLDEELRRYIRWSRDDGHASADGILAKLASLELKPGSSLTEDELVAHANILSVSSNEPIAVALTWVLLVLSQLPELRSALANEFDQGSETDAAPSLAQPSRLTLLDAVLNESLRLLTPNALMVRVTTRPVSLDGVMLPQNCEVVLCPFLAHRDAEQFPRPNEFLPSRWETARPSPFAYFPFGAGGHSCVGYHLAICMIKAALAEIIPRYDLVLAEDQEVDWRVHIQFMPGNDVIMKLHTRGESNLRPGKLLGPVSDLISLDAFKKSCKKS